MRSLTRAALIAGVTLAVFVPSSSGATAGRTFSTAGTIAKLAADGQRVAVLTTKVKGSCDRIVVWNAQNGRATNFTTHEACPHADVATIPYTVWELALGDGQVAWSAYDGGNETEVFVYAARLAGGKPKELELLTNDSNSGEGDDAEHLLGGGSVLAYNRELGCALDDNGNLSCDVRLVRIHGVRTHVVARDSTLAAVAGTRMTVTSGGTIALLRSDGSQVATLTSSVGKAATVAAGSTRVAVQSSGSLDLYSAASGATLSSLPLGTASSLKLAGVNARLALLRGSGRATLMRLTDGKQVALPLEHVVDARLTEAGLFYAYNTPTATRKGHVAFESTARLMKRF
jgi:hypothetical protein